MTSQRTHGERGSVMVITAFAMFALMAMTTFAIDVSHWFDYSRNLQNRADAAALAGGSAYGDICFGTSPGDTQTGPQSVIGKWAQLYSGAGVNEPVGNLPYTDAQISAAPTNPAANGGPGTSWSVAVNGYINNTLPPSPVNSPLTLKLGSLDDYLVRLNADDYAVNGGSNFFMGTFCNADSGKDKTDQNTGHSGAMVDVKVSQHHLPDFIPLFNILPNISAHARVEIEQQESAIGVRPIAVSDATYTPCVTAYFIQGDNPGNVLATETLTQIYQTDNSTNPPTQIPTGEWQTRPGDAKTVHVPASGAPVTVQLFLNNCSSTSPTGSLYDYYNDKGKEISLGLVYINNWGTPPQTITTPTITTGGVTLLGPNKTSCDPYFQTITTGNCLTGVDAHVAFPTPAPGVQVQDSVRAVDTNTGNTLDLPPGAGANEYVSAAAQGLQIDADSGPHPIEIQWAQLGGQVGGNTCLAILKQNGDPNDPWANSNKCQGSLGVQQRAFAGVNGTNACNNPPYETGPMQWITVGDSSGNNFTNAFGANQTPTLVIDTQITGLKRSGDTDPPICLRVAEQTSHATGFVDCGYPGQPGGKADQLAIEKGCPPVQIDTRTNGVDNALICSPPNNPLDCVQNDPGQSPPVLQGFDNLIGGAGGAPANCETNYWPSTPAGGTPTGSQKDLTHDFTIADKRAVIMMIVAPTDMAVTHGTADIPIRAFAVFYVTGWSDKQGPVTGCNNNDPKPSGAGSGEIWGHWTNIVVPSGLGTSTGKQCQFKLFGNCVAVLTR